MKFKKVLTEDVHFYIDKATGKRYIFDGTSYVEFNDQEGETGKGTFKKWEDEQRKAQLEKDKAEFGWDPQVPTDEEEKARIQALDDILGKGADKLKSEVADEKFKEKQRKAKEARTKARYERSYSSLKLDGDQETFKKDLAIFAKQLSKEKMIRTYDWSRENQRFAGSGIVKRVARNRREENKNVPIINVYMDVSGSFSDRDIANEVQMVSILNGLEKKGLIKKDLYFIGNSIQLVKGSVEGDIKSQMYSVGRGNMCQGPEIIEHLKGTKADNMIIMTDSDIGSYEEYELPGGVWRLFKNGSNNGSLANISGKQGNKNYSLSF